MPSGFTDDYANKALDHMLKGTVFTPPAAIYMGLATADPGPTPTLASIAQPLTANGYARVNLAAKLAAASGGSKTNSADIAFTGPATPGAWGTITHYFICDAASGTSGNVIWTGVFGHSRPVNVGGSLTVVSGTLALVLARNGQGGFSTPFQNKLLDHMLLGTTYTQPGGNLSVGLSTADPGATGVLASASEEAGTSYARQTISTHMAAAAGAVKLTNADISFPAAGAADWTNLTNWFITEGTNVIYTGAFTGGPFPVGSGDVARLLSGLLGCSLVRT